MNPPSVTVRANNTNKNISITRGSTLTLNWAASNNPSNCVASGSWSGTKSASGNENRSSDARTSGTRTYRLTCSNAVGSASAARTVTISNPPPQSSPPTTSPKPSPPTPSAPTGRLPSPVTVPSAPSSDQKRTPTAVIESPGTIKPPQKPTTFSAVTVGDSTVHLTWRKPENDTTTTAYEIQRSIDKKNWETLHSYLTDELYIDSTIQFETKYYYRVRSIGTGDHKSSYVLADVTTGPFVSNTTGSDLTLQSEDQQVSVIVPDDAIVEDAFCSLRNDNSKPAPEIKNHKIASGPYEILCKNKRGTTITDFRTDLSVSVQAEQGSFVALKLYSHKQDWQEVATVADASDSELPVDAPHFVVLGENKSSSVFIKILVGLGILAGTTVGGLFLLNLLVRYKQQQAIKSKIADYRSKERGY